MKEGQRVEQLGVCLVFAPEVPEEFQETFETALDNYITKYNSQPHAFTLTECQDNSSLLIQIENVKYTTSSERATGIAVTTLGLIGLPATLLATGAPLIAAFYYIPQNTTLATVAFSNDIAHPSLGAMAKAYNTGGIFGNDEKQRQRHAKKFDAHLTALFSEIESSYKKTAGKVSKTAKQQAQSVSAHN